MPDPELPADAVTCVACGRVGIALAPEEARRRREADPGDRLACGCGWDTFRRARPGDAPWLAALHGVVVGRLVH